MKGWFNRDEEGKVIIDSNGFVTITCEEENVVFQIHISEIDEKAEQMCFNVNGKDIYIDVVPWEMTEIDSENEKIVLDKSKDNMQPTTSKGGNVVFPWCDASTKIFLKEYKEKRELVRSRKLKNMKNAYQEIAKNLTVHGFGVSPLQVENRYKTLKRAYRNMLLHNRRNGRGKYLCSYEQDLDEIFSSDLYDVEINDEEDGPKAIPTTVITKTNNVRSGHQDDRNIRAAKLQSYTARLDAQNMKIIEHLHSCQRLLKNMISRMDNKHKTFYLIHNSVLQTCIQMKDMQKQAYARAEEQREKAKEQREMRNNLLAEIVTILKSRKDT